MTSSVGKAWSTRDKECDRESVWFVGDQPGRETLIRMTGGGKRKERAGWSGQGKVMLIKKREMIINKQINAKEGAKEEPRQGRRRGARL